MSRLFSLLVVTGLMAGCGTESPDEETAVDLDSLARDYVVLELAMGLHDAAHVDAYFGPPELRDVARDEGLSLADIDARAAALATALATAGSRASSPLANARVDGLLGRLRALRTRVAINEGHLPAFDEESERLFGVTAPDHDAAHFDAIIRRIDALLQGHGPVAQRVVDFRKNFIVPPARLPAVFNAAIAECRARTIANMDLPDNEAFTIEYVNDKSWSGYNWYQGNARSLIQINTDLPIYISRAVDLGCHEGYPGHHTYNLLLEENLVEGEGWIEYSLYPLFSPQSLIAEGSGNYGIKLAFPGESRVAFEKEVLFPLAGLDPTDADRYYELQALLDKLDYADNEAARDYLDGRIDAQQAAQWLVAYKLMSPERARQRVAFIDTYRSYVINYNLGRDMVADYIERGETTADERWARFARLLSTPLMPADLQRR
ncbi:MAG: hypothetical protein U5K76_10105 [Woeseiaceae bacterium]|nr:hypothetical protein [Woeseiaceae bacterium]